MRLIMLSCGHVLKVSDEDFLWVIGQTWTVNQDLSVQVQRGHPNAYRLLSHLLAIRMGLKDFAEIDHANRERLDFQRHNLRPATRSQNCANKSSTGLKGASRKGHKWQASIKIRQRIKYLGLFDTPEQAHEAYRVAAIEAFGEFACVD